MVDSNAKADRYAASPFLKCFILVTDVELLGINPREASNQREHFQSLCICFIENEL